MRRTGRRLLVTSLLAAVVTAACTSTSTSNPLADAMCDRGLPDGYQDVSATPRRRVSDREVDRFVDEELGFDKCRGKSIPMTGSERVRDDAPTIRTFAIDLGEDATSQDRRAVAAALRRSGLFTQVSVMPRRGK